MTTLAFFYLLEEIQGFVFLVKLTVFLAKLLSILTH